LSERHNPFLRPLKKKGFKEKRVTTMGVYDIGTSHDPGIQQEPFLFVTPTAVRESYEFDVAVHFSIRHGLSHTFGPLVGLFLRPQCPIVARIQITPLFGNV